MSKDTKLVHFTVIDGTDVQIKALTEALLRIKKELPEDMEFLVTNDKYQLRTVKDMIEELYTLYKREGKILDQKKENLERARKELLEAKGETKNEN